MFPAIKNLLLESAEVSALVKGRIFPDFVPEKEKKPAISMFLISTVFSDLADGTSQATASSWQVDCIDKTRMDVCKLADAVVKALHKQGNADIKSAVVTNRNNELPDAGVKLRRTIIDVLIKHY